MSRFEVVQQFVRQAQTLRTREDLFLLMKEVTDEMGFRYFAVISHVDFRRSLRSVIRLDNYPESWTEKFVNQGLYVQDPILQATLVTNVGFAWTDVPNMIPFTERHRNILEGAFREGLGEGFTVPASIPGEYSGSCSFATRHGARAPVTNFHMAHLIGSFAFQAARRLSRPDALPGKPYSRLTQRQRDCIIWAMKGKTDWEIGRILGLKEDTVTEYLDAARDRYGVAKRLPLAIRAIFDGQISFLEALF